MTRTLAIAEAVEILKFEANELALLEHRHEAYDSLPKRAKIAIHREIVRLREIATSLAPEEQEAA